jgi:hypothetical protein
LWCKSDIFIELTALHKHFISIENFYNALKFSNGFGRGIMNSENTLHCVGREPTSAGSNGKFSGRCFYSSIKLGLDLAVKLFELCGGSLFALFQQLLEVGDFRQAPAAVIQFVHFDMQNKIML